jgi:hypothetical protein
LPQAWHAFVERQTLLHAWQASLAVGLLLYGTSLGLALAFGEAANFLEDPRWPTAHVTIAASAYYTVWLNRTLQRMWTGLGPWLANGEGEVAELQRRCPAILYRYALPIAVVLFAFSATWVLAGSWSENFDNPDLARALIALQTPLLSYFGANGIALSTVGMFSMVRCLASNLSFKPGFILHGAKAALRPLYQMQSGTWLYTLVIVALAVIGTAPLFNRSGFRWDDLAFWLAIVVFYAFMAAANVALNPCLTREKAKEVARLRSEIEATAEGAGEVAPAAAMQRVVQAQLQLHDLAKAEAFNPSLVDLRFVIQVSLSVTGVLISNVLLRTVLADLLN